MGHHHHHHHQEGILRFSAWLRVASLFLLVAIRGAGRFGVEALEVRVADVTKTSFIEQLQEPQYVVALRPGMRAVDAAAGPGEGDGGLEPVVMTDKDGKKWRCSLPPIHDPKDSTSDMDDGEGNGPKEKSPADYLQLLSSTCFYRVEGWWTYELCYMKKVRQYHQGKTNVEAEFILGEFDADASEAMEADFAKRSEGAAKYFPQKYKGGTPCDITHTPRETEVRFTCGAEQTNILTSIKEPSTCSYVIVFTTPLLCKHPAFREKAVQATPIYCDSLDGIGPAAPGTSATLSSSSSSSSTSEDTHGGADEGASEDVPEDADADADDHEAAMKASMERVAKALASVFSDAVDEAAVALEEGAPSAASGGSSREGEAAVEGEGAAVEGASDAEANEREGDPDAAGSPPAEVLDLAAAAEVTGGDYSDYDYVEEVEEEGEEEHRKEEQKDEL